MIIANQNLTSLEARILSVLVSPQTSTELFEGLGIGYPYGIKVLRKMVKKGLVDKAQHGNQTYYHTIRTGENEELFELRAMQGESTELVLLFEGQHQTFSQITARLYSNKTKDQREDLLIHCRQTMTKLISNSWRKKQGLPVGPPFADDLRRGLQIRLAQERRNIKLAEALLEAPIWTDKTNVHTMLTNKEVTEQVDSESITKRFQAGLLTPTYKAVSSE